jgi:hypothetical protein
VPGLWIERLRGPMQEAQPNLVADGESKSWLLAL